MSGLKLFFKNGGGDLRIENGSFVVADDLNTLVLTSQFSHVRLDDDVVLTGSHEVNGYWAEDLMAINGRRWGSEYWYFRRAVLGPSVVTGMDDAARDCVQHLIENGVVDKVAVKTERQGVQRVAQRITLTESGDKKESAVGFSNLWDVIRADI